MNNCVIDILTHMSGTTHFLNDKQADRSQLVSWGGVAAGDLGCIYKCLIFRNLINFPSKNLKRSRETYPDHWMNSAGFPEERAR